MSTHKPDPQACLLSSFETLERRAGELEGLVSALAPARLTPEQRRQVDDGLGLAEECNLAYEAQRALAACPAAAARAGTGSDDIQRAVNGLSATQEAITTAADFHRAARHGTLVFLGALGAVCQAVRSGLEEALQAPELTPAARDALAADLRLLTAPAESEAQRAREARKRTARALSRLREEVAEEEQLAEEDLRFLEGIGAPAPPPAPAQPLSTHPGRAASLARGRQRRR